MNKITENTFAAACYNDCTIQELYVASKKLSADKTDCAAWGITPAVWRESIELALQIKIYEVTA